MALKIKRISVDAISKSGANITVDLLVMARAKIAGNIPLFAEGDVRTKTSYPGVMWIHGGGYYEGFPEVALVSRGGDIARKFDAVVIAPRYRLSGEAPYPAAIEDCHEALRYIVSHADEFGIDLGMLMLGGESAGGGLVAALCQLVRDEGDIKIAYQFPLYPMIDYRDTPSSADNHSIGWNTKRNHRGWKQYLRSIGSGEDVPVYASTAVSKDYSNLPPCYTYVCDGEPFLDETVAYVKNLRDAGVKASVDVYHMSLHSFDLLLPLHPTSRKAIRTFVSRVGDAINQIKASHL